jgi:hypothetical protein
MSVNEKPKQICSECLFTGEPQISIGRLLVEFILNLLFVGGVPLFQKVRHCPECGGHSMVAVTSKAGQIAEEKLMNVKKDQQQAIGQEQRRTSVHTEHEYTRIRIQR